jgi:hypothetical protein
MCDMEGRITTPPTMPGVQKRKAGQSRRHIEAKQSKTIPEGVTAFTAHQP